MYLTTVDRPCVCLQYLHTGRRIPVILYILIERVHCIMKVGLCKETKALRNTSRVAAFSIKHIDCTAQLPAVEIYSVKKTKTPEVPKLLVLQDNYPCFCAWEPQSWASSSEQYQFDSTTIHSFESRKPEKWDVDLPIHNSIYKLKEKKRFGFTLDAVSSS